MISLKVYDVLKALTATWSLGELHHIIRTLAYAAAELPEKVAFLEFKRHLGSEAGSNFFCPPPATASDKLSTFLMARLSSRSKCFPGLTSECSICKLESSLRISVSGSWEPLPLAMQPLPVLLCTTHALQLGFCPAKRPWTGLCGAYRSCHNLVGHMSGPGSIWARSQQRSQLAFVVRSHQNADL